MFVKEIKDYDKFSNEADIIISDGQYNLLCYCYPTDIPQKGERVKAVTSFLATDMMRARDNAFSIKKIDDYYSYHLQGEVIDMTPKIRIGNIIICLDNPLPKDIKEGEYIELLVGRLDCNI